MFPHPTLAFEFIRLHQQDLLETGHRRRHALRRLFPACTPDRVA